MTERCVCCGKEIPEGRQVCPTCEYDEIHIKDSGNRREFENGEEWKPVIGYEGLYEVSSKGRVKSMYENTRIRDSNDKILMPKTDYHGYLRVNLHKNGIQHSYLISRLVAQAFIENPYQLPHVGHNDDDKLNNNVENLYWTEPCENNRHNGKMIRFQKAHNEKIKIIVEKLSHPVKGISIENGLEIKFSSMKEAERNGFNSCKISMCVNGKRKTHKGYRWEVIIND